MIRLRQSGIFIWYDTINTSFIQCCRPEPACFIVVSRILCISIHHYEKHTRVFTAGTIQVCDRTYSGAAGCSQLCLCGMIKSIQAGFPRGRRMVWQGKNRCGACGNSTSKCPAARKAKGMQVHEEAMGLTITGMTAENAGAIPPPQPFDMIGCILPEYRDGQWSYKEEIFARPKAKTYTGSDREYAGCIQAADRAAFLCYSGMRCIGSILLSAGWNRFCVIQDIAVVRNLRGRGTGTALFAAAAAWAMQAGLGGIMAETQDNNLLACRFYAKMGMKIGAVDNLLYANFDTAAEKAVFWYLKF
jgi:streptothricin acetyltransferase